MLIDRLSSIDQSDHLPIYSHQFYSHQFYSHPLYSDELHFGLRGERLADRDNTDEQQSIEDAHRQYSPIRSESKSEISITLVFLMDDHLIDCEVVLLLQIGRGGRQAIDWRFPEGQTSNEFDARLVNYQFGTRHQSEWMADFWSMQFESHQEIIGSIRWLCDPNNSVMPQHSMLFQQVQQSHHNWSPIFCAEGFSHSIQMWEEMTSVWIWSPAAGRISRASHALRDQEVRLGDIRTRCWSNDSDSIC